MRELTWRPPASCWGQSPCWRTLLWPSGWPGTVFQMSVCTCQRQVKAQVREAWLKRSLAAVAGAYALEVVTSCQVLVMFCFSSFSGVMPSFLLMSATCLSLAARTWDRVWISSSTCTHTHTQLPLDSFHSPLKRPDLNTNTNSDSSQRWQRIHKFRQTRTRQAFLSTVESRWTYNQSRL